MRDQEIIGLYEAYNQICESSEILSERDEMEQNPLLHLTYAERAKRLKDKAEQIRRKKGKNTRTEEIELDEEAPERIRKRSKNPRLMKDAGPARVHNPKKEDQKESYDLFDTILEHLVAEGYADTNEAALVIMANMSEEWRQDIVEGMGLSLGASKLMGKLASNPRTPEAQATKAAQKNITDPIGFAVKDAIKAVLGVGSEKNKQMMQKRLPN